MDTNNKCKSNQQQQQQQLLTLGIVSLVASLLFCFGNRFVSVCH